jgi:hypothetical protein
MALGAFANAPVGSKKEIMARSAMAPGTGNNSATGFLAHFVKLFGIAMPLPPEGSEKASIDVLRPSAQGRGASQV